MAHFLGSISRLKSHVPGLTIALALSAFAPAAPASAGYEARLQVTIPIGEHGLDRNETSVEINAGRTDYNGYGPDHYGYRDDDPKAIALLSFTADGYLKRAKFKHDRSLTQEPGTGDRAKNQRIIPLRAQPESRARSARSHVLYCTGGRLNRAPNDVMGRHLRTRATYCRVLQLYQFMIAAYRKYQMFTGAGRSNAARGRVAKNAYFDYWVAHKAYKASLRSYNYALQAERGRRPNLRKVR